MSKCFLGVDVGGTFTDVVLATTEGDVHTHKVVTTAGDPLAAVTRGVQELLAATGRHADEVTRLVHGTTLATNIVLERRGCRVALVTTEGFGDLLRLGREARVEDDRYDLFFSVPDPPVERRLTFEAPERVKFDGSVLRALTPDAARTVAARVAAESPDAVAVCLLHSYAQPAHEHLLGAALRDALPSSFVTVSSDVWPELREYDRAMTTTLCAYVGPVMAAYLHRFQAAVRALGVPCAVEVMDSSGGVMPASRAAVVPVATIESGGAAGVLAAALTGRWLHEDRVVSFDMGGTTAKTGVVRAGRPDVTYDFQVGGRGSFGSRRVGSGLPVKLPVVDLAEVGAGGGSIAWVDRGGAVRVGPRSAGSSPGPACYGWGGTDATVTDADLVLGYLAADRLGRPSTAPSAPDPDGIAPRFAPSPGGVDLQIDLAAKALEQSVAEPLGIDVATAAGLVHEVVNVNMAAAIRVVTVQRGIDPREFTFVGFGGAGPVHVARLAQMFGVRRVAVPWAAGVGSALGLLATDMIVERARTCVMDLTAVAARMIEDLFTTLERDACIALGVGEGGERLVERSADLRWAGQSHQLTVPLPRSTFDAAQLAALPGELARAYRAAYGVDGTGDAQFVTARVRVTRSVSKITVPPRGRPAAPSWPEPATVRDVWFADDGGFRPVPVHHWRALRPGDQLTGPALVEGPDTTIVVPPGFTASVDQWRTVVLETG